MRGDRQKMDGEVVVEKGQGGEGEVTEQRRKKKEGKEKEGGRDKTRARQNREAPLRQVVEGSRQRAVIGRVEEQQKAGRRKGCWL